MLISRFYALALIVIGAQAFNIRRHTNSSSSDPSEYGEELCTSPGDYNQPCVAAEIIRFECTTGQPFNGTLQGSYAGANFVKSFRDEQTCICQSQFFNEANGCTACYAKHGLADADSAPLPASSAVISFSSSYCEYTNTATAHFDQILYSAFSSLTTASSNASATATTSFSDPIGSKTDVSLYYTPSVTGSAVYSVQFPATGSGSTTTTTAINTSNGQIVAVTTTTKPGAAMITAAVDKMMMAGAVGAAAVAACL